MSPQEFKRLAFRNGDHDCHWCGIEMWFGGLETPDDYKDRNGDLSRKELRKRRATVEHLIPKSRGGPDAKWNLAVACNDCNSRRGAPSLSPDDILTLINP